MTRLNSEVWAPRPGGVAQQNETELIEKTVGCDAIVVFYGAADPDWVGRQMMQVRKYSPQRSAPPRLSWVVYAPPEPKPRLGVRLRGWTMVSMDEAVESLPRSLQ